MVAQAIPELTTPSQAAWKFMIVFWPQLRSAGIKDTTPWQAYSCLKDILAETEFYTVFFCFDHFVGEVGRNWEEQKEGKGNQGYIMWEMSLLS